ncbi:TPA: hypothetical protein ACQ7TU_003724, partial [Klebsiella pneumoniae]
MAITDTQQTAQFAAEAAVSAAEAKQYLIEVQQGYQDISATTQEAINAATAAEASKVAAETAEQNSSASAVASSESATAAAGSAAQAEEYKNDASEYALNKFTFYKTPSDPDGTIAGLAATTNGQSFRVAEGPEATAAFKTYENQDGVAVLQASQPGTAAITGTIREFPTLAAAQADADAGNIPTGSTAYYRSTDESTLSIEVVNNAGTLQPTGRKMPSYDSIKNLIGLNENTRFIFPEDGEYEFGIPFDVLLEDAEHNIIYMLNGNKFKFYGDVEFDSLETGVITVNGVPVDLSGILSPDEKENLVAFSDMTKFSSAADTDEFEFGFGFDVILEDMNGNLIYGIKGTEVRWFTSARFPAVKCDSLMVAGVNVDPNGIPT